MTLEPCIIDQPQQVGSGSMSSGSLDTEVGVRLTNKSLGLPGPQRKCFFVGKI